MFAGLIIYFRYVDNAVQKLRHKSELADKVLAKSRLMEEKEAECEAERENLSVRIPPLIEYTKELQSLVSFTFNLDELH